MIRVPLLLAVAVVVSALAGCGDDGEGEARVTASDRGSEETSRGRMERIDDLPDVVDVGELPPFGGGEVPPDVVVSAQAFGSEHADHFAGLLVAQGHAWLGFTADAEAHLAELRARTGQDAPIRAFRARFTEAELLVLQAVVTGDMTALRDEGIEVSMVAVSVQRNRVEIGIEDDSPDAVERLRDRYGADKVHVSTGVVIRPVGT